MEPDFGTCTFTLAEWTTARHLRTWVVLDPGDGRIRFQGKHIEMAIDAALIMDGIHRHCPMTEYFPLRAIRPLEPGR